MHSPRRRTLTGHYRHSTMTLLPLPDGKSDVATAIAVQLDGKIVLGGESFPTAGAASGPPCLGGDPKQHFIPLHGCVDHDWRSVRPRPV